MSQCSTRSQEYDAWSDIIVYRTIGGEIVEKTVSVCAKVYNGEIEYFYKTKGSEELTPAEWDHVERQILDEVYT